MQTGAAIVLLIWTLFECLNNEQMRSSIWHDPTCAIFMCIGDFLLLQFMWGVSMFVWKRAGIDFLQLLQLQDCSELVTNRQPAWMVLESATRMALIFLIAFIAFSKAVRYAARGGVSLAYAHGIPVLLALGFLHSVVHPFSTRRVWLAMLGRALAAPWYPVLFRDGFIGDILTSLVRVLVPCAFSLLYVLASLYAWLANDESWAVSTSATWWTGSGFFKYVLIPFLTLYPLWIRLLQCLRRSVETGTRWPHLANALKYASAIIVISFATFQPQMRRNAFWLLALVCATLFQYTWDLLQDWGMLLVSFPPSSASLSWTEQLADIHISIRKKRLLGPAWSYILVMGFNLALRFAWVLTLLPAASEEDRASLYATVVSHVGPIVAAAEIVRRMVWGFYRLEFEQLDILQRAVEPVFAPNDLDKVSTDRRLVCPLRLGEYQCCLVL
jgi:hypothetical protein